MELPRGMDVCFINEATEPCGTGKKGDAFLPELQIKHQSLEASRGK